MAFLERSKCVQHVNLTACHGAEVRSKRVCLTASTEDVPDQKRQSKKRINAQTTITNKGNASGNASAANGNATVTNNVTKVADTVIIVSGNELGDLIRAGTAAESELIQRTILENADLRRAVRTVENIPSAVFNLTKGTGGPQRMRNVVKRTGSTVAELRQDDLVATSATVEYCKTTALKLVEELRNAIQSVNASAPKAVQEWAQDVSRELAQKKFGGRFDYPTVLRLYVEASGKFYKLPPEDRLAVSGGVKDIAMFISKTADF